MLNIPLQNDNIQVSVALQSTEEVPAISRRRNRGMSIHELNQNSEVFSNTSENQMCSICHDLINTNNICRRLSRCRHTFHQSCIDQWLNNNQTCPLCMQTVIPQSSSDTGGTSQENTSSALPGTEVNLEQILEEVSEELDNEDNENDDLEDDLEDDLDSDNSD